MILHCALLLLAATAAISSPLHDETIAELPVKDCGWKFGCLALPNATCLTSHNGADCHTLMTYQRDPYMQHTYEFSLYQRQPVNATDGFWMALGFSIENNLMPNTTIVECRYIPNAWPRHTSLQTAYAGVNATRPPLARISGVFHTRLSMVGQMLKCSFFADRILMVEDEPTVDLKKPIFLLIAQGLLDDDVIQHHQSVNATNEAVNVGHYPTSDWSSKTQLF